MKDGRDAFVSPGKEGVCDNPGDANALYTSSVFFLNQESKSSKVNSRVLADEEGMTSDIFSQKVRFKWRKRNKVKAKGNKGMEGSNRRKSRVGPICLPFELFLQTIALHENSNKKYNTPPHQRLLLKVHS
jgi:hypothetical protein